MGSGSSTKKSVRRQSQTYERHFPCVLWNMRHSILSESVACDTAMTKKCQLDQGICMLPSRTKLRSTFMKWNFITSELCEENGHHSFYTCKSVSPLQLVRPRIFCGLARLEYSWRQLGHDQYRLLQLLYCHEVRHIHCAIDDCLFILLRLMTVLESLWLIITSWVSARYYPIAYIRRCKSVQLHLSINKAVLLLVLSSNSFLI